MSYYDEDFYYEPSEFDMQMEELKVGLLKSVKEEFIMEMDRLKKENEELQEVKSHFEEIKNDYKKKEYQLEIERKNLESKVKRERLSSLMKDFEVVMYRARTKHELPPKCDKCNNNRKIKYKTPLGRDAYEDCSCNNGAYVYYPEEYICSEFKINRNNNDMSAWYKLNPDRDGDYATFDSSTFAKVIYKEIMKYEELDRYDTFFKTEEECQRYCDYLNEVCGQEKQK